MLADSGYDAEHVASAGLIAAADAEVWNYARHSSACVLTKDEDFARRWLRGDRTVPIVWLRIGNCSRRALAEWLMPQMPRVVALLAAGETLIEIR